MSGQLNSGMQMRISYSIAVKAPLFHCLYSGPDNLIHLDAVLLFIEEIINEKIHFRNVNGKGAS